MQAIPVSAVVSLGPDGSLSSAPGDICSMPGSPTPSSAMRTPGAERARRKRERESVDEKSARRKKDADRARRRREKESPEERARRREKDAERQRKRRSSETPDQRAARLKRDAERMRSRREKETPEEKEARRRRNAQWMRTRRLAESADESALSLVQDDGRGKGTSSPPGAADHNTQAALAALAQGYQDATASGVVALPPVSMPGMQVMSGVMPVHAHQPYLLLGSLGVPMAQMQQLGHLQLAPMQMSSMPPLMIREVDHPHH